jgi:hypothetical protein
MNGLRKIPERRSAVISGRESNLMALTVFKVKNAKSGRHVDGRGLCLVVKPSGARTWVLRMQLNGQRRDFGRDLHVTCRSQAPERPQQNCGVVCAMALAPWQNVRRSEESDPALRPRRGLATKHWEVDGRTVITPAGYLVSNGMCSLVSAKSRLIRRTMPVSSRCSHPSGSKFPKLRGGFCCGSGL